MSNQIYASAVRSATLTGDNSGKNPSNTGLIVVLNVTAVPGVDTVQLQIQGLDPASGTYYTLLTAAARAAAGQDVLSIKPGITATANVSAAAVIPDTYRIRVIHSAATAFTYSVSVNEVE